MKNIIKSAAFLFLNLFWISACTLISDEEELSFILPGDFNGTAASSWSIRWIDSDGNPQSKAFMSGSSVCIKASKNSVTAVLAFPALSKQSDAESPDSTLRSSTAFAPKSSRLNTAADSYENECLGILYPFTDSLSYDTGFAAEVFYSLYIQSSDSAEQKIRWLNYFNWQRFLEECRCFENPWLLDKERIVKAIAGGSFKKTDLRIKAR